MKAFVFEHICGGGMLTGPLPDELAAQGRAMLICVAEDLVRMGIDVTVTHDPRVPFSLDGVTRWAVCDEALLEDAVRTCAAEADVTLLIAPEFEQLLARWHRVVRPVARDLLNCSVESIELCSDKLRLGRLWEQAGVPTPAAEPFTDARQWSGPVVVKPNDGAGCERTCLCVNKASFARLPDLRHHMVQTYVEGTPASVLCIVNEDGSVLPLRAGRQIINISVDDDPHAMTYLGGELPLPDELEQRAVALGIAALQPVEGLRGFVGVDMVLGRDSRSDYAIEINPRVTMSYVGLRQLCESNIAECLFDPSAGARLRWRNASVRFDAAGTVMRSRG